MAVLGRFVQTSAEKKQYVVDYSQWLNTGELLTAMTFAVTPATVPPIATTNAIGSPATSSTLFLSGGVDETEYTIVITATTNAGQIKQDEIILDIDDYDGD